MCAEVAVSLAVVALFEQVHQMCIRDRLKAVLRLFVGPHRLVVHGTGAAESGIVAVQDLFIGCLLYTSQYWLRQPTGTE